MYRNQSGDEYEGTARPEDRLEDGSLSAVSRARGGELMTCRLNVGFRSAGADFDAEFRDELRGALLSMSADLLVSGDCDVTWLDGASRAAAEIEDVAAGVQTPLVITSFRVEVCDALGRSMDRRRTVCHIGSTAPSAPVVFIGGATNEQPPARSWPTNDWRDRFLWADPDSVPNRRWGDRHAPCRVVRACNFDVRCVPWNGLAEHHDKHGS